MRFPLSDPYCIRRNIHDILTVALRGEDQAGDCTRFIPNDLGHLSKVQHAGRESLGLRCRGGGGISRLTFGFRCHTGDRKGAEQGAAYHESREGSFHIITLLFLSNARKFFLALR